MAIDFPASPSVNDTYTVNGVVYTWDGTKWTAVTPAGDKIVEGNTNAEVIDTGSDGRFVVTTEGTEALRVDSSQRVGIGVTTPATALDVRGSQTATIRVGSTGSGAAGDEFGNLEFYWGDEDSPEVKAKLYAKNVGNVGPGGGGAADLLFATRAAFGSLTERMRITQAGKIFINTTSPATSGRLTLAGDQIAEPSIVTSTSNGTIATQTVLKIMSASNTVMGSITHNNLNAAFNTSSDYRLKENVVSLVGATERLLQIQVRRFNYTYNPNVTVDGFIAHEVQAVVPECVTGEKDAVDDEGKPVYQGIDQSKLVPLLTAALQEAITRIETLEAEVAAIKAS